MELANLNCPGQIVISGAADRMDKACELARAKGAKKAMPLTVAGAYHSQLMAGAKARLQAALAQVDLLALIRDGQRPDDVRAAAALALAHLERPESVQDLRGLATSGDIESRYFAVRGLTVTDLAGAGSAAAGREGSSKGVTVVTRSAGLKSAKSGSIGMSTSPGWRA